MSEFGKRNPLPTTSQRETAGETAFQPEQDGKTPKRSLWKLFGFRFGGTKKPKPRPDSWAEDVARKQHEQNNLP